MAEDWVKAHSRLMAGKWRGVPRATRFVLLELAIEARPLGGIIELPYGTVDPVEALVDLLAGSGRRDRREVREAVRFLSRDDVATVRFERVLDVERASIPSFATWNAASSSAERMRAKRARDAAAQEYPTDASKGDVTHDGNGDGSRGEERRGEEIQRQGDDAPQLELVPPEPQKPSAVDRVWSAFLAARSRAFPKRPPPALTEARRKLIRDRLKNFTEERLAAACAGFFSASSFNVTTENGKFATPEKLFDRDERVERHEAAAAPAPGEVAIVPPPANETPEARRLRRLDEIRRWKGKAPQGWTPETDEEIDLWNHEGAERHRRQQEHLYATAKPSTDSLEARAWMAAEDEARKAAQ